eukprot:6475380-Amphidinium_carterae.1
MTNQEKDVISQLTNQVLQKARALFSRVKTFRLCIHREAKQHLCIPPALENCTIDRLMHIMSSSQFTCAWQARVVHCLAQANLKVFEEVHCRLNCNSLFKLVSVNVESIIFAKSLLHNTARTWHGMLRLLLSIV